MSSRAVQEGSSGIVGEGDGLSLGLGEIEGDAVGEGVGFSLGLGEIEGEVVGEGVGEGVSAGEGEPKQYTILGKPT